MAGRREMDLAEVEGGSIERDLARRDFTVNAMAFEIGTRLWLDPFHGALDLWLGRLRLVSEANLREDPLRALRGARLIATHRLKPDRETSEACRKSAPGLARVAPERIRSELVKLLQAPEAAPALRWASRAGILEPALAIGQASAQRLARGAGALDSPRVLRIPPEGRGLLRLAWICARLGLSSGAAARWLSARRFSRAEAGQVAALLELVGKARAASSEREEWGFVRDSGDRCGEALALLLLLCPDEGVRARRLARRAGSRRRGPTVRGGDILLWLGSPPGPAVGQLLRELEIETSRGAVRSRRQARKWLISHAKTVPPRAAQSRTPKR